MQTIDMFITFFILSYEDIEWIRYVTTKISGALAIYGLDNSVS